MKKLIMLLVFALAVSVGYSTDLSAAPAQGGFQAAPAASGGGFSGPHMAVTTVQQAKGMRDDALVTLRGNIIQHMGKDNYLFKDETGTIVVEIDHDKWNGQTVTPEDTVELVGEVDKDWNSVEIDVDRITLVR